MQMAEEQLGKPVRNRQFSMATEAVFACGKGEVSSAADTARDTVKAGWTKP